MIDTNELLLVLEDNAWLEVQRQVAPRVQVQVTEHHMPILSQVSQGVQREVFAQAKEALR